MVNRNVKFQYFGLVRQRKEGNHWKGQGKVDIFAWLNKMDQKQLLNATVDLGDVKASVDKVKWFENENVWVFRFMKLRDDNVPSIVKEKQESKAINLDYDEYIGEGLHMLYDNETGIAMLQVNRFSLGIKRLEDFLSYIWENENERIKLKPILDNVIFDTKHRRQFKCIEVSFCNISPVLEEGRRSLGTIMNVYRKLYGVSGKLKISLGRTRKDTLSIDGVEEIVEDALQDDSVDGLKLHVKDDDARPVEVIDLFDKISKDILTFKKANKATLDYSYAAGMMKQRYMERKAHLVSLIGQ